MVTTTQVRGARRRRALVLAAALVVATPVLSASAADTVLGSVAPATISCGGDPTSYVLFQVEDPVGGPSYAVPGDGVITSWSHRAPAANSLNTAGLRVARASTTQDGFDVIGRSEPLSVVPGAVNRGQTRIPVARGDVLGMFFTTDDSNGACTSMAQDGLLIGQGSDAAFISSSFVASTTSQALAVAATLEPDADRDGFGDTTQDGCPTQAGTQGTCFATPAPVPASTPPPTTSVPPASAAFTALSALHITGKARPGRRVKVVDTRRSSFVPAAGKVTIRWSVGSQRVKSAKGRSFTVTRAHLGKRLIATITVLGSAPTTTFVVRSKQVRR